MWESSNSPGKKGHKCSIMEIGKIEESGKIGKTEKIALLGGTFNPIHIGHLFLADEVKTRLGYDKVLFVPVWRNPFKDIPDGAANRDRIEMLEAATKENPAFDVELCEIERESVSYTSDTIAFLQKKYASVLAGKLALVIGDDLVHDFAKWHNVEFITENTDIVLANRTSASGEKHFPYAHISLDNAVLPVSSSGLRTRIKENAAWQYLVPYPVAQYIKEHKLYDFSGCHDDE
ncbi:MAG: nicotinate (nicotinamide) nucleotide adenylyltransferase [Treponemataceae bacterium]|nr:MAG: nicotinate (nicotinamide) nucleotide adenylyltransferase [Treponemataceae bacterium]